MLFVADIGNTSITVGIYKGEELLYTWKLASDKKRSEDEYGIILHNLINQVSVIKLKGAIISSVAYPLTERFCIAIEKYLGVIPINLSHKTPTNIKLSLDKPQEVGADRIANACAAYNIYKKTTVVVDFGTATSFDIVNSKGEFLGGIIAPGIRISSDALNAYTSKLPKIRIEAPKAAIGKNTIDAMLSGLVRGHAAMIDGLMEQVQKELQEPIVTVATGGYSTIVTDCLKRPFDYLSPNLTLDGLRMIYEMNANENNIAQKIEAI